MLNASRQTLRMTCCLSSCRAVRGSLDDGIQNWTDHEGICGSCGCLCPVCTLGHTDYWRTAAYGRIIRLLAHAKIALVM